MKLAPAIALAAITFLTVACSGNGEGSLKCNGHAELCDRKLNEVAFATTHNSMSARSEPGWQYEAHDTGIREQLSAGIRGFQIDTYAGYLNDTGGFVADPSPSAGSPPSDRTPQLYLCHAQCDLGATELATALGWYRDFLEQNPDDVLILFIEDHVPPDQTEQAFTDAGLLSYLYTHDGGDFPTLESMVESGQRLFVMAENLGGSPAWYHPGFELTQETAYDDQTINGMTCAPRRGAPDAPLFQLNHFVSPPRRDLSATINDYDFLLERAQQCQRERGQIPNLVAVNFYEIGDVLRVVDMLNDVSTEPSDD